MPHCPPAPKACPRQRRPGNFFMLPLGPCKKQRKNGWVWWLHIQTPAEWQNPAPPALIVTVTARQPRNCPAKPPLSFSALHSEPVGTVPSFMAAESQSNVLPRGMRRAPFLAPACSLFTLPGYHCQRTHLRGHVERPETSRRDGSRPVCATLPQIIAHFFPHAVVLARRTFGLSRYGWYCRDKLCVDGEDGACSVVDSEYEFDFCEAQVAQDHMPQNNIIWTTGRSHSGWNRSEWKICEGPPLNDSRPWFSQTWTCDTSGAPLLFPRVETSTWNACAQTISQPTCVHHSVERPLQS